MIELFIWCLNGMLRRIDRSLQGILVKTRRRPSSFGGSPCDLWKLTLRSFAECRELLDIHSKLFHERRTIESTLEGQLAADATASLDGVCWVCSKTQQFYYDRKYSDGTHVNWRERLVCKGCDLNNRLRLSMQVIDRVATKKSSIYITEQVTPLAACLARKYPKLHRSEYLGDGLVSGSFDSRGIRHEDVTSLSFDDDSFDLVLSFDVLEHVPNYCLALKEFRRVLKEGGTLILSAPFALLEARNVVRARINERGEIEHLLAPEYHGDPVDPQGGVLCYYHFGWQLVEELKSLGFTDAKVDSYWSRAYGHIGAEQLVIVAKR